MQEASACLAVAVSFLLMESTELINHQRENFSAEADATVL
jgi:hypothetical protein